MIVPKRRRDKALKDALSKLFPPLPLSENELHDSFIRLCNFPHVIQECICYELCWTESDFSKRALRPLKGQTIGPNEREILIIREVLKLRLNMLMQYLETVAGQPTIAQ